MVVQNVIILNFLGNGDHKLPPTLKGFIYLIYSKLSSIYTMLT
jgi:hypothetical protein